MPAKDIYHNAVKNALVKDGWTITHDPLHIGFGGFDFFIDLGAENLIGADKDGKRIAVEIKSFAGTSSLTEFHLAGSRSDMTDNFPAIRNPEMNFRAVMCRLCGTLLCQSKLYCYHKSYRSRFSAGALPQTFGIFGELGKIGYYPENPSYFLILIRVLPKRLLEVQVNVGGYVLAGFQVIFRNPVQTHR